MTRWTPCDRRLFLRRLRALGFEGPFAGTRHQFMARDGHRLAIPANREYSVPPLHMMVREVEGILGRTIWPAEGSALP